MFNKKIEFDLWANQLIFKSIKQLRDESVKAECTRLFAHLFKAQIIWFNRVNHIEEKVQIWGEYTVEECSSLMNDSRSMLEGIAEKSDERIQYHDTKGKPYENSVPDIFDHVIIHGQHHRAQIMWLLRSAGLTPPPTDYIYFLRSL